MAFDKASEVKDKPTAILAKTFKGAGVKGEEHVLYFGYSISRALQCRHKVNTISKTVTIESIKIFYIKFIPNTEITRKRVVDRIRSYHDHLPRKVVQQYWGINNCFIVQS